ncbi:MAG TPA: DUF5985 family protein [Verrucomicrobiae bacterium]|nr:DUF5985 family protein [Verrucomicrobiae bacterium]
MTPTHYAISGAILLGYSAISLIFYRFLKKSKDRFFGFFSCAFLLLAFERTLLIWAWPDQEEKSYVYAVRLISFLFILYAIVDKNRKHEGIAADEKRHDRSR